MWGTELVDLEVLTSDPNPHTPLGSSIPFTSRWSLKRYTTGILYADFQKITNSFQFSECQSSPSPYTARSSAWLTIFPSFQIVWGAFIMYSFGQSTKPFPCIVIYLCYGVFHSFVFMNSLKLVYVHSQYALTSVVQAWAIRMLSVNYHLFIWEMGLDSTSGASGLVSAFWAYFVDCLSNVCVL